MASPCAGAGQHCPEASYPLSVLLWLKPWRRRREGVPLVLVVAEMPLLDPSVSGAPGQRPEAALEAGGHVGLCAEERGSGRSGLSAELKTHLKNPNVTTRGSEAGPFSGGHSETQGAHGMQSPARGGITGSAWTEGGTGVDEATRVSKSDFHGPRTGLGGPFHEGYNDSFGPHVC